MTLEWGPSSTDRAELTSATRARLRAGLLAELFMSGHLDRVRPVAFTVYPDSLHLQLDGLDEARALVQAVVPDAVYRESTTETSHHHVWKGSIRGMQVQISALTPVIMPAEPQPAATAEGDEYLSLLAIEAAE